MARNLNFSNRNSTLRLESDQKGWCKCFLEYNNNQFQLGADSENIVIERLLNGLTGRDKKISGQIEGADVFCILTLFEKHHTLYASEKENGSLVLYWQDANAKIVCVTTLSAGDRNSWIAQLKRFQ